MGDAPIASSERSTIDPPRLDAVAEDLRDDIDASARLAALEEQVQQGQSLTTTRYARPPPVPGEEEDARAVRLYTVKEVAGVLRIGISRAYEAVNDGRIPAIRFNGRWLIPHNELVDLLERLKRERGLQALP